MLIPIDWRYGTCTFYLWQEHEAEAKEYHKAAECSVPRTPTKADIRSYLEETPSTKLDRKMAKDVTNREVGEDISDRNLAGKDSSPQTTLLSDEQLTQSSEPAAKATRTIFSTPGQQPTDGSGGGAVSLTTPDSRSHIYTGKRRASYFHSL
jgi:hypothetical protein